MTIAVGARNIFKVAADVVHALMQALQPQQRSRWANSRNVKRADVVTDPRENRLEVIFRAKVGDTFNGLNFSTQPGMCNVVWGKWLR
jgi:hypothetical protein